MVKAGLWKKEFISAKYKFLVGAALLFLMGLFIALSQEYTVRLLENVPIGELKKQVAQLKDYRFWVWSQWFGKNLPQVGSIIALIFGAGLISSEVSGKTIGFLLTKPVKRTEVFQAKYFSGLMALALAVMASTAFIYIVFAALGKQLEALQIMHQTVIAIAGMSVLFSMAAYFSTVFDQTMQSFIVSALLAFLVSVPGYFPPLVNYSLYYHMAGYNIYSGSSTGVMVLIVFILISAVFYILGRNRFVKKDF